MKVRLLGLGAVLLLASSLSPRLTGAGSVLLHYHFVAGQVITYQVTSTARLTEREGSQPASTATVHLGGTLDEMEEGRQAEW